MKTGGFEIGHNTEVTQGTVSLAEDAVGPTAEG